MTVHYRGPRIPPRGPSGASRQSPQPHFTLDVMEFLEESKRMERHKAREQLLEAVERVAVTEKKNTGYHSGLNSFQDRDIHAVKRDMIAAVKSVLG